MVLEFHRTFGSKINDKPTLDIAEDLHKLRIDLIEEEFKEYKDAIAEKDLIEVADALGDLAYVIYGAAVTYGIDLDAVIAEIHRSNMTKLGTDGKPIYRSDGKVMKGPNYEPPNIEKIIYNPVQLTINNDSALTLNTFLGYKSEDLISAQQYSIYNTSEHIRYCVIHGEVPLSEVFVPDTHHDNLEYCAFCYCSWFATAFPVSKQKE